MSYDSYVLDCLYGSIGIATLKNTGTRVLRIYRADAFIADVDVGCPFAVDPSPEEYSVRTGKHDTVIATIQNSGWDSLRVSRGKTLIGARIDVLFDMEVR